MTTTTRSHYKLNAKEQKVLAVFLRRGRPAPKTIAEIAGECWSRGRGMTTARAQSWVRNSLRRLVSASLLERCATGTYEITDIGRELVKSGILC
jgi:repressor of nif and glnA expression